MKVRIFQGLLIILYKRRLKDMEDRVVVDVSSEDIEKVEILFDEYNGYMGVLSYLLYNYNEGVDGLKISYLDKKWDAAIELSIRLEKLKNEIANKYRPQGAGMNFSFNFAQHTLEFYN